MKYMLLIYSNEAGMQNASKTDVDQMMGAYAAYTEAMAKAGVMVGGRPPAAPHATATTVRTTGGKTQVLDGPYAETKEQLGGYYLIDVPDLDAALSWAARCPGASHGAVEVRPIWADVARDRDARRGRPARRRDRRSGGAPQLRQAGRLPRGPHPRRGGRRGRPVRRLRRGAGRLARARHAGQARRRG